MKENGYKKEVILVAGAENLTFSVVVCLLQQGHQVLLYTKNKEEAAKCINKHFSDSGNEVLNAFDHQALKILTELNPDVKSEIALIITAEDLLTKAAYIQELEKQMAVDGIIAVNTESIALSSLQNCCQTGHRIIGLNWTEPAHTTYFLEIISNDHNPIALVEQLFNLARASWKKDPYILKNNFGIRSRMMAAMAREAFYLIENEYVNLEDIDRACKNDAGYYLPFAGNFRYMDLMGTYAYGMVMKDLNPELSKETSVPEFFCEIVSNGGLGMKNNQGFYTYQNGEVEQWQEAFRKFSYDIQKIISKYPFNTVKKTPDI